jgi:hypothetical protein
LHLAASTMESAVERAVDDLLAAAQCPDAAAVKRVVAPPTIAVPALAVPAVDLHSYDRLLAGEVTR